MKILPCDDAALRAAAALLNAGGVAVIPTDTVYGLAAHPAFPAAVERLYAIKGRARGKKIALLAADAAAVGAALRVDEDLAADLDDDAPGFGKGLAELRAAVGQFLHGRARTRRTRSGRPRGSRG